MSILDARSLSPVFDGLAGGRRNGFVGPALLVTWQTKVGVPASELGIHASGASVRGSCEYGSSPHVRQPLLERAWAEAASLFSEACARCWRASQPPVRAENASLSSEAMAVRSNSTTVHPSLTIRRRHPSRYILGAWRYHRYRHRAGQGVAWPDVLCGVEHDAIEQGVEADEAKRIGASQLNSSVRRTMGRANLTANA